MKTVSWLQGLCKVVLWWTMKLSYNVIMPLNLITQAPNSICVLTLALLSLGLLLCVTDQQLLWEHGPVWNRTVYAPTAAAPGPPPHPHGPGQPPEEAPQVDPQTRRSIVRRELCNAELSNVHNSVTFKFSHLDLNPKPIN